MLALAERHLWHDAYSHSSSHPKCRNIDGPVGLVAFSQAWFEPFVVTDSLPTVDANWIGQVFVSLNATVSGRAWLARGPAENAIGATAMLFFQNSDEPYPVFSQPSLSPKGSSVHVSKVPRTVTVGEHSAIFCVEVAATVSASVEMFEAGMADKPDTEAAQPTIDSARAARDILIGAFALYQYPLIWRYLDERNGFLLVNSDTKSGTKHWERPAADNFIPFRLDATSKLDGALLRDGVIESAGTLLANGAREPLALLKDSMWHSDLRTRFLLQFWIIEYFADQLSGTVPPDDDNRRFVTTLEALVSAHAPDDLARFKAKMFDARWGDDPRDRDDNSRDFSRGSRGGSDPRERERPDPRDVFMEHVNLPRGLEREHVHYHSHDYTLRTSETRTLTTVGAFRAVPASDLRDSFDQPLDPRHGELWHLRDSGPVQTVRLDRDHTVVTLTKDATCSNLAAWTTIRATARPSTPASRSRAN